MKKLLSFISTITLCTLLSIPLNVQAQSIPEREYIEKNLYCVTEIQESVALIEQIYNAKASDNKTASKTVRYENANGETLWYVKVTGSFTYNGTSSSCTSASVSADTYSDNWKISDKSSKKSGNKATATATGNLYFNSSIIQTVTKTVTLSCSKTGELS